MQSWPAIAAPLEYLGMSVTPEYIDANGHMNVGFFNVAFDRALDKLLTPYGLDWSMIERMNTSFFVLETHVCYLSELLEGAPMRFTLQLLDADAKRLHYLMQMFHAEENRLAATSEQVMLHVSMETRRSAPFTPEYQKLFADMLALHSTLPRPPQAGKAIELKR